MDRRVKERLVGATILLGLVVVVVPELLSGPKHAATPPPLTLPVPVHSYTVDVTNHSMAPTAPVPTVADAASSAMPSAASTPATEGVPSAPPPAAISPSPSSEPLESAGPPPILPKSEANKAVAPSEPVALPTHPSGLAWGLQLGSFASKSNAEKLVRTMAAKGYPATVSAAGSGSTLRYRVRIGSLADREAAERMLLKLKAQGQAATLVPPAP